jgi:transcription antitermination factor NusA-like protein
MGTVTKGGISRVSVVEDELHPKKVRAINVRNTLPARLFFPISSNSLQPGKETLLS